MISNEEVLRRVKVDEGFLHNSIVKQKMAFAGHILRGSSGDSAIQILEANWKARLLKEDLDVCGSTT